MLRVRFVPLYVALLATTVGTIPVQAASKDWKATIVAGNWSTASNWVQGVIPTNSDTVSIGAFVDGVARTVTYDYTGAAVTLNSMGIDLTGIGATTTTLSMSANDLTSIFEYVGYSMNGRGAFNQSGGTNIISLGAGYLDVGVFAGATGAYNLSGSGALASFASEYIGDIGTGVFNQSGGANTIIGADHNLYLGYSASGLGTYLLSAGTLSAGNYEYVGFSGTGNIGQSGGAFNQTGGTNSVVNDLVVGRNVGSTGAYMLSGTGSLTVGGLVVGENPGSTGTFSLQGGALRSVYSSTGSQIVGGFGAGIFNQTAGSNAVANRLFVGWNPDSTGTYTLSGGTLTAGDAEFVGSAGTGNFSQAGGVNSIGASLWIAAMPGSTGTYALSGGSTTVSNASIHVGGFFPLGGSPTPGGAGVLTVGGAGVLTTAYSLSVYDTPGTSVNLSGGTINASQLNFNGAPSRFNWTTGKLNLTSDVTWDSAADPTWTSAAFGAGRTLVSNQTLIITGNETLGGGGAFALTLNSGSTHAVTGALTVAANGTLTKNAGSTLSYASLTQAGGTINGTLVNQSTFTYQGGLFNGRLWNQGSVSFGSNFVVGNGLQNDADITINAGQTLTVNGPGLDNQGNFALAGGALVGSGPLVNNSAFTGHGTLAGGGGFTNNSSVTVSGGTLMLNNSGTNANSGQIVIPGGQQLRLTGGSLANPGAIYLNGGTVSGTATLNNATGIISGHGTISSPLANTGLLIVDSGILNVTQSLANGGEIFLGGGPAVLSGGALMNNSGALIRGSGRINNNLTNDATGTVRSTGSERLVFAGGVNANNGNFDLVGGTLEFTGALTNGATGSISGYGALHTSTSSPGNLGVTNNGMMQFSGGNTAIRGGVNNTATGKIITAGGSITTFFDDVVNNGQVFTGAGARSVFFGSYSGAGSLPGAGTTEFVGDTRPGNSPASIQVGGNVVFDSPAHLFMELAGTAPGTQFDQVRVLGQLSLGGALEVSLMGGFAPSAGQSFDILDWGSLSGAFASINYPTLAAGLRWNAAQLYTTGVLSIVPGFPEADFDENGSVNAADLANWKLGFGTRAGATHMQGDANGDGSVGGADLLIWQRQLGSSAQALSANAPVPEPASLGLFAIGLFVLTAIRSPRHAASWSISRFGPRSVFTLVKAFAAAPAAHATAYSFNRSNGRWDAPSAWTPGGVPISGGSATLALASVHGVDFYLEATGNLNVLAGHIAFSPVVGRNDALLSVTDATALPNSNGGTSVTLAGGAFGTYLNANHLSVQNGATLTADNGSAIDVTGKIVIDGPSLDGFRSELIVNNGDYQQNIGTAGGSGSLILQNGAFAKFVNGGFSTHLGIADDASSGTGRNRSNA